MTIPHTPRKIKPTDASSGPRSSLGSGIGLDDLIEAAARRGAEIALESVEDRLEREPAPALLTTEQLARELGCSGAHVARLTARSALPFIMVGDARRYRLAAVLAALEARK